ncbi:MAG TPA: hypothetical protein VF791_05750 [Pyrinomonadaceae bacterium]
MLRVIEWDGQGLFTNRNDPANVNGGMKLKRLHAAVCSSRRPRPSVAPAA